MTTRKRVTVSWSHDSNQSDVYFSLWEALSYFGLNVSDTSTDPTSFRFSISRPSVKKAKVKKK